MKILQMTAVILPLLATIPTAVLAQSPQSVVYTCEGGRTFSVDYAQEAAQLRLDSVNVIPLPRAVSGSGIRYSNGSTTLYSQGNQAFIEEGGQRTYKNCVGQAGVLSAEPLTSRVFVYQCTNNQSFEARYQPQSVELMLEGSPPLTLSQVPAASGARYSDGETTLFTKGNEAFLEKNGTRVYDNCFAQTPAPQPANPQTQQPASTPVAEPEPIPGMW
jgi:membrane-bound inhibitor of C-type lysozyme